MLPLSAASLLIKEASGAAGETRTPTGFNPLAPAARLPIPPQPRRVQANYQKW